MFCKETNFQETTLGKVPKDWQVAKLMDVSTCKKGRTPKSFVERTEQGSLPYLSAEALRTGEFTKWVRKTDDIVRVCRDDVLLIWDGYYCGDSFTGYEGALSSTMVKVETENLLNKKFLFYFLRTHFRELNLKISGMYLKHVNKKVFESLLVPLPSVLEQQQIVEVLSCVDLAIQKTCEVIAKTERLKKGLMQKLLTERIGHKEFKDTEIGKIPKEWQVVSLGEAAEVLMGQSPLGVTYNENGKGIPLINGPSEFTEKFPKKVKWTTAPTKLTEKYDVLICVRGHTTGRLNIADGSYCIGRGVAAIRVLSGIALSGYLFFLLEEYQSKIYNKSYAAGSTFPNITRQQLASIKIPLPSLEEQRMIFSIFDTVDKKLELEKSEKAKLERVKLGLMDLLLTGKVRVRVD
jgi:type I restriction enzyme S subunit